MRPGSDLDVKDKVYSLLPPYDDLDRGLHPCPIGENHTWTVVTSDCDFVNTGVLYERVSLVLSPPHCLVLILYSVDP